ncbi:hypothetical protein, partial [Pseudomonas rustica]|nr:hypothetical protein [Pseudomonas rustica]
WSGDIFIECTTAFASKLTPTGSLSPAYSAITAEPCGSGLAGEGVWSGDIFIGCTTAFASRLTPTGLCVAHLFGDHRWIL